jgi:hypothetical protein
MSHGTLVAISPFPERKQKNDFYQKMLHNNSRTTFFSLYKSCSSQFCYFCQNLKPFFIFQLNFLLHQLIFFRFFEQLLLMPDCLLFGNMIIQMVFYHC